jgi:hypothetical protein
MALSSGLSKENQELAKNLSIAESDTERSRLLPNERKAQIYTCLAHDWYQMDMEEEGARLLSKAEKTYPGYFKGLVIEHTLENDGFDKVVKNLTLELAYMLLSRLGEAQ